MTRIICCLAFSLFLNSLFVPVAAAESDNPPAFRFSFHGYVHAEMFYDNRQMVAAREGNAPLFPQAVNRDAEGNDLNGSSSFTFSLISSRFSAGIVGPEMLGAVSSAFLEVDFLGTNASTFNLLRMRHAYMKLNWARSEFLAGQYWHPMFVTLCFPGVIQFGAGVPYHVLNRSPQLRFTHQAGPLRLAAMLVSQNDFSSLGPLGMSSTYIRNSGRPEVFGQAIYEKGLFLAGASAGYKTIRPRTTTSAGYRTNETLSTFSGNIFTRLSLPKLTVKMQAIYGEELSHLILPGGYGEAELIDPLKGIYSYTGIRNLSAWIDLDTSKAPFHAGLFAGHIWNLGTSEPVTGDSWIRGNNIARMYRLAPRAGLFYGGTSFNLELLYDVAAYGMPGPSFRFEDTNDANNLRILFSVKYIF